MKRAWVGLALIAALLVPVRAGAQSIIDVPDGEESRGLSVSPAIFEVVVKPGETVNKEFYVHNTTPRPLPIQIQPRSLEPIEETIVFGKISTFNADDWITVDEPYHILTNQENQKLTATITAPKDAEPGGHYAMVSVDAMEPIQSRTKSGASITPRIGIIVFITVPGPAARKLSVGGQRILPFIISSESVKLRPKFLNTGTIHVMQNSKAIISNAFGRKEIDIPPRIILPNTKKEVVTTWENTPILGIYKVRVEGSYGPEQTKLFSENQYILVFRWLPLLIWCLPLVAGGWLAWKTRRNWRKAIHAFLHTENKN